METTALKMFTETVHEENNLIWVRPVCDFFQIDVQNQYIKIKNDAILSKLYGKNSTDLGKNDKNGRILLTKKGFIRWIQIINPNIIPAELRDRFIEYQEKVSDFLLGSIEEHQAIASANNRLQQLKASYSETGNEIKRVQAELNELLNMRYQYRLPFANTAAVEKT